MAEMDAKNPSKPLTYVFSLAKENNNTALQYNIYLLQFVKEEI